MTTQSIRDRAATIKLDFCYFFMPDLLCVSPVHSRALISGTNDRQSRLTIRVRFRGAYILFPSLGHPQHNSALYTYS